MADKTKLKQLEIEGDKLEKSKGKSISYRSYNQDYLSEVDRIAAKVTAERKEADRKLGEELGEEVYDKFNRQTNSKTFFVNFKLPK